MTRTEIVDLSGNRTQAAHLRATVARMGNNDGAAWFEQPADSTTQWHQLLALDLAAPTAKRDQPQPQPSARRRTWPYVAAIVALTLTTAGVWQKAESDTKHEERQQKVAAYKGRSGAHLRLDSVEADVVARWTRDRQHVIVQLTSYFGRNAKFLRIDGGGQSARRVKDDWFPGSPEIELPVKDPYADVTVRVAIGGKSWQKGSRAASRAIRLSPTGVAYDGETGDRLPSDL